MNELKTGVENPCCEVQMESKPTNDTGIYLEVVNGEAPAKQQTSLEYQGPATKKNPFSPIDPAHSDKFLNLRRMLWIVTAVAFISLLTSAATLILALRVKNSQNVATSPTIVKYEVSESAPFLDSWIPSLPPVMYTITLGRSRGKHHSRENKTNWFREGPDIKCFVIPLDFHFNSNKRITGANQNSRLGTYSNTKLILKTRLNMIYKVLSLYYMHLFRPQAAVSLLG